MFSHRSSMIALVTGVALVFAGCSHIPGAWNDKPSAKAEETSKMETNKKKPKAVEETHQKTATPVPAPKGFYAEMHDGRMWVFKEDSKDLQKFRDKGELAKHVIRPGAGPGGVTLKAPDTETIIEFMATKPGFEVSVHDGRIWVFKENSEDLQKFQDKGELAKHVIRPGAGPGGVTLKAPDTETIVEYMAAKPGFEVSVHDGRVWVFKENSKDLQKFRDKGELAKHVIRPGAGPGGVTLKAPDTETIIEYMAAKPGFEVSVHDGRVWVFQKNSKELQKFRDKGELAKHVIRPGAGPGGVTLKAPDTETINRYLASR